MSERAIAEQKSVKKRKGYGRLLWVSVMLHSLLVLLPWAEKTRSSAPPQEPIIPIVAVAQVPGSTTEETPSPLPAVPLVTPEPSATVSSPPANPSPIAEAESIVEPVSNYAVEESIVQDPASLDITALDVTALERNADNTINNETTHTSNSHKDQDDRSPDEPPSQQEPGNEAALVAAALGNFVDHVQRQSDGFSEMPLLEIFNTFRSGQANPFFDENDELKVNVSSYHHYTTQTPEQVLEDVIKPELTGQQSLALQPQENFSHGLAYQIVQGDIPRYLTIVRLNNRSGSLVILSDALPPG
ncbi:MAG: hypothetical protein AAFU53_08395 [Cyanobacteria bacterium J06632_3]